MGISIIRSHLLNKCVGGAGRTAENEEYIWQDITLQTTVIFVKEYD